MKRGLKISDDQNKMEALLRREKEVREDLNRAQQIAHIGSWRMNVVKNQLLWSDEVYRIFEIPIGTALNYEMFLSAVHPDDRNEVDARWQDALHGEKYDIEHRIIVNSVIKWVRETAILEVDNLGNLQGGFGTVQDITQKKEAELALHESEEKFAAAFISNPNGLVITDYDTGEVLDVNESFLNLMQFSRNEVIGKSLLSLNVFSDQTERDELIKNLETKGYLRNYEFRPKKISGSGLIVLISSELIRIKGRSAILSTIQDITSERKMQELLKKKNDSLTRINALLKDFVSIAAHDLRSPVSSLLSMGEYIHLLESVGDKEKAFNHIVPLVNKLQRTIDGLLEMIMVETQSDTVLRQLEFRNVVDSILADCLNEYGNTPYTIETDFKVTGILYVEAYLISVMKNLITNAVKYSSENKDTVVKISTSMSEDFVLMTISDNGSGMDLETIGDDLFKPFTRFTTNKSGTGMGLYIVKNIIEQNGGFIRVVSKPGEGTSFFCYLKEYTPQLQ